MAVQDPNKPPALQEFSHLVIKGVITKMSELYNVEEPHILFVSTTDRYRIAQRLSEQTPGADPNVTYPQMFLHLLSMSINKEAGEAAYNMKSLARHGIYTKRISDNQWAVKRLTVIPVLFEMEVIYIDNEFFRALNFVSQWLANAANNRLNFTVEYYGVPCDIRISMVDNVSTPDRDESVDRVNYYEYTSSMRVHGYVQSNFIDDTSVVPMVRTERVEVSIEALKPTDPMVYDSRRKLNVKTWPQAIDVNKERQGNG